LARSRSWPALQHVVESGLHLLGRTHAALLQVDADHFDADLVAVEDGLHQRAHARADLVALLGERRVHLHLADHLAHGRLGSLNHGSCGFLLSNSQARASLRRYCTANLISTMFSSSVSIADSFRPVARMTLSRPTSTERICVTTTSWRSIGYGRRQLKPAPDGGVVAAEARDHGLLAFLHDEDAGAIQMATTTIAIEAGADACALHVGLEVAVAAAAEAARGTAALACRRTGRRACG
jgi:hypothetical protein